MPAKRPRVLALFVKRSRRKGSKGKTIVSPSRSFNSVKNALSRVEPFGFDTAPVPFALLITISQISSLDF